MDLRAIQNYVASFTLEVYVLLKLYILIYYDFVTDVIIKPVRERLTQRRRSLGKQKCLDGTEVDCLQGSNMFDVAFAHVCDVAANFTIPEGMEVGAKTLSLRPLHVKSGCRGLDMVQVEAIQNEKL
jgi:hypothetical protein